MRGLALAAALLAAAVLSGCGAYAVDEAPSLDEVAAATRADSYRFETSMETEGIEDAFTATATGAADPAGLRGVIRYRFDGPDEEGLELEVRRIGDDTYTRYSGDGSVFEDGWSKEATSEADELTGPFGAFSEPHRAADALAHHGRDVATEPGERIDGVLTTLYRATVPTVELLGGGATKARRDELEEEIRKTDSESSEVEAWAGADGLLRRLEFEVPITEEGKTGRFRISMRFADFGTPIDVEVPPASEINDGVIGDPEPCKEESAPHSAESVVDALRKGGFSAHGSCDGDETIIYAFPREENGDKDNDAVICVVTRGPKPSPDFEDPVVEGNVACMVEPNQRAAVRTILDGL